MNHASCARLRKRNGFVLFPAASREGLFQPKEIS